MVRSFESRSARFLSLTISRFLAFSSSFTIRRLSSLESFAEPISASSSATCFSTKRLKYCIGDGQELEGPVRDDHGVIVSGGDPSHRLLAVASLKVVLPGDEKPSLRVQLQKLRAPLIHQMIRHDEHRLLRQIQTAEFHRGGGHRPGLARSHDMRQQWTTALEDAPDGVLLMRREISVAEGGAHHSGQG